MTPRSVIATCFFSWLALFLTFVAPTLATAQVPPDKQIQITDVRVGFPAGSLDLYKEGKWVPVLVTVGPPKEVNVIPADFQGTLEVSTKDSDGWNTHIFKDNVVVTREANRAVFQSYIKVSDAASFNGVIVRLRGKLGTTEINHTYSYPQNDRTRNNLQYGVDHEKLLVVNIGNSYGFVSTDENEDTSSSTGRSNVPQQMPRRAASPNKIHELPDRWYGYESVDAVIIATGGNFGNSLAQQLARDPVRRDALEQWVLQGGHLIISVGGNAPMVASPTDFPLEPLFPMKVDRTGAEKEARLDGLRDFIIQGIPQNIRKSKGEIRGPKVQYARMEAKPGLKALNAAVVGDEAGSKRPLIVRSPYGLGKITLIGFDTNTEAFQSWENKHDFWGAILEARTVTPQNNNYYGNNRDDASLALANRIEEFGDVPVISFAVVAMFIALYIILIGPVDYFVLKKVFKRLEYTWITFPTVVLLVSLAAYYGAYYLKGDKLRINKVDLVEIDIARERVMGTSWFAIFSPRLQNYNIDLEPQGVNSAVPTLSWLGRYSMYSGSRMIGQSQGGLFERDYDYTPSATGLRQLPIQVWSQKSLEGRWLGTMDRSRPLIESSLMKERLYITGKIRSKLPVKLYGAKLLYADKVWNLGDMEPDKDYDLSKIDQSSAGVMMSSNYFERKLSKSGDSAQQPDFAGDMNGLLFASRSGDGNTKPNEFLRFLNQSWRLKDYGEAVLIGTLADEYGDAAKLNQGGALGTKLKLTNGAGDNLVTGTMRQSTFLRVFIPVKESSSGP